MPAFPANEVPTPLPSGRTWPGWARWIVSGALAYHLAAVVLAGLADPPSSPLEQRAAAAFRRYYELTDLRQSHRYYGDIGGTPVATAEIQFRDGQPSKTVLIPDPSARPRILYQRQLALAYHLTGDVQAARESGVGSEASVWARSYARHLCRTHPGASSVTLKIRAHVIPPPERLLAAGGKLDVDADEFFTPFLVIGDFPCPDR